MSSIIKANEIQNSSGGADVKIQTLKHPSSSSNNLVLASDGSATATLSSTSVVPASVGGTMVFLEKFTASNTGSKIFNLDSYTSYDTYLFGINGLRPGTDNASFRMWVGTSSSDSDMADGAGQNRTVMSYGYYDGATNGHTYNNSQTCIIGSDGQGNDAEYGMNATIHLYNPTSTTLATSAKAHMITWYYTSFAQIKNVGGYKIGASDDAYVKIGFSAGSISSGTITLYGIKDD